MRAKRSKSRSRRVTRIAPRTIDVVSQLECAVRHPRAAALGALLGGVVPWFARALAHGELPDAWRAGDRALALGTATVVLGCCLFSVLTVYKFGLAAFGDARKAAGFVAALEGVMLVSRGTTSIVALLILVAVNAVTNGCSIALSREATGRRAEADARRSATRSRNREGRRVERDRDPRVPAPRAERPVANQPRVVWQATDPSQTSDAIVIRERRVLA